MCLPVYFNEPLSALQKMAEELEYSELLDKARLQSNAWCHLICNLAAAHGSSQCRSAGIADEGKRQALATVASIVKM